jgi:hypothetical protein
MTRGTVVIGWMGDSERREVRDVCEDGMFGRLGRSKNLEFKEAGKFGKLGRSENLGG